MVKTLHSIHKALFLLNLNQLSISMALKFYPAKHSNCILRIAELGNAIVLAWHNRLRLDLDSSVILKKIPKNSGLILVANHSDENYIKIFIELSRRSNRRFTYMINAEAFEEWHGIAGWFLQRLGSFSVERGVKDLEAIRYAGDIVKKGQDALIMFPEGEIYYLNDLVQPFKTGAVHIGLQALIEAQAQRPGWAVYIVPIAIKYRYRKSIISILNKRIRKIERHLSIRTQYLSFKEHLIRIMGNLLKNPNSLSRTDTASEQLEQLKKAVTEVRTSFLSKIEAKYHRVPPDLTSHTIERAQKMIFFLREQLKRKKIFSIETRVQIKKDLSELKQTIQMAGWQPGYIEFDPTEERLAETVMKLEREAFKKKRPTPLGDRMVYVRIGNPLDLSLSVEPYKKDPSSVSHQIAEELRDKIQSLIEKM